MQLAQGNRTVRAVICNEVCSFFYSLFEEKGNQSQNSLLQNKKRGKTRKRDGGREKKTDRQTPRKKYLQALKVV